MSTEFRDKQEQKLRCEKLVGRPDKWDQVISEYDTKTLFHQSCWLDHVLDIYPGSRIDYYRIVDDKELVGYYCAHRVKKAGIPIHGSPLGGTGTNYMGPIVNKDVDQRLLIRALTQLFGLRHFLHLEISHYWLDQSVMADLGFAVYPSVTHLVKLPENEEEAWAMLKGTARNRARKAEKSGLQAVISEDGSVVAHFFEQFIEVYAKQNMVTPFGIERPQSLFDNLNPAGSLLPLMITYGDEVVAAGLFPYDENCIYFWGAASWLRHQKLCPNELLHWQVIKFAVSRGIRAYNMCGGTSQFKNKFGGEDVPYVHYSKSFTPLLQYARNWYKQLHYWSLKN